MRRVNWAAWVGRLNRLDPRLLQHPLSRGKLRMAKKSSVHVVPDGTGWKVTQGGEKVSGHRTQANAIDAGRTEARRDSTELVVHGRNGQIRQKDSFGNDPH